jgi:hypothetical protein
MYSSLSIEDYEKFKKIMEELWKVYL